MVRFAQPLLSGVNCSSGSIGCGSRDDVGISNTTCSNTLRPSVITILPFDQRAAEWHASERARLGGIGLTPPFVDSQIAAVAFVNDLTLVTANTADFSNFDGLRVEDWTQPDP